jgi:hypothetical protein
MALSDDFRAQLKAGNLTDALALALSKAVELKITTWVASAEDDFEAPDAKPGQRLRTHVKTIDGKIENEIGDQFIGNGPYRELRQFHLDQVAEGSKIIQNNLKSLQKLFEVLVATRYQVATPSVVEPDSLDVDPQLLPPAQDVSEPDLEIPPYESTVDDSVVSSNALVEDGTDDRDEDDWDDSVLDLLESLPVTPQPRQELNSSIDEDWRDFITEAPEHDSIAPTPVNPAWETLTREDFESSPTLPTPEIEALHSLVDEDWRGFVEDETEPRYPTVPDALLNQDQDEETPTWQEYEPLATSPTVPESLVNQDDETPSWQESEPLPTSPAPTIETSSFQSEDDWGWEDLVEEATPHPTSPEARVNQDGETLTQQDSEPSLTSSAPNIEAPYSQVDDDDWGNLVEEEPTPTQDKQIPSLESLDLETEDEWDDWVVEEPESSQETPVVDMELLDLGEDDDWGDLVEDTNPFAAAPTLSGGASDLEKVDEDWDNFTAEELDLFSAFQDVDITDTSIEQSEKGSIEELDQISRTSETNQSQEEREKGVLNKDSDLRVESEDDLEAKPKSVETRVPPPPNHFPGQNT